jgi:hypothetical protein
MEKVNVATIGGGFMGKAHALAQAAMPMFFWPAPAIPVRRQPSPNFQDGYIASCIADALTALRRSKLGRRSSDEAG